MNPLKPLILTLIAVSSAISAFPQSKQVKVTIRAVETFSTYDRRKETERYRYRFWIDGTEFPNSTGCLKAGGAPNTWNPVNYYICTNKTFDIDDVIKIEAEGWEDDDCKDGCRYNDTSMGCDDGGHCGKNTGLITQAPSDSYVQRYASTFVIGALRPGNVSTNIIAISFCSGKYVVKFHVTYSLPKPTQTTLTAYDDNDVAIPASADKYQLCSDNKIDLATSTSIDSRFNGEVKYEWYFNINGEEHTVYHDNPLYCGNSPVCDGAGPGPGDPPIEMSFQRAAQKDVSILIELPPGDEPPPCCYEDPYYTTRERYWKKIPGTANPSLATGGFSFDVRTLSTNNWNLSNIKKTAVVNFMVRVISNGSMSEYSDVSKQLNIAPLPPKFGSDPLADLACPGASDGIIHLTNVTGIGNYKYNLRPGFNNDTPCDPDKDNCFQGNHSKEVAGPTFEVEGVAAGQYTLWLVNFATQSGSCASTKNVEILSYDPLSISLSSSEDVLCNGASEGKIVLGKTGGKAPFTYTLTDQPSNTTGEFTGLKAGAYHAAVVDGCLQSLENVTDLNTVIRQPIRISESLFDPDDATCASPGNGAITSAVVKSAAAFDKLVSPTVTYRFILYKDGGEIFSYESLTPEWSRPNLPPSNNYELVVMEKGGRDCNSYHKTFAINGPDPLGVNVLDVEKVSCFGGDNGHVAFEGDGGSDQYIFKMSKAAGDTISRIDGDFTTLEAGNYTLVLQNGFPGCKDQLIYPTIIKVEEPERITATLTKTDISCYGEGDGKISAVLDGGTPDYSSVWQEQINSKWISLSATGTLIEKRESGTFRLMITDDHTCVDSSAAVTIIEPRLLTIDSVAVHDIKCLNETGTIELKTTGGTGAHTFFYSRNGGLPTDFTSLTPLGIGDYVVSVKDINGCADADDGTYVITMPPSMLDFSYKLSDYNGYNISCFGGSNGDAVITPIGGNGGQYSGYRFAKDDGAYLTEPKLEGFNAGVHKIAVIDARGCVVSKNMTFTQTDEAIALSLDKKKDIACYGDLNGEFYFSAQGGLSPYQFKIDEGELQSSGTFIGLAAKTYHATVVDKNSCDASYDFVIAILNPPIEISAELKDVSCFAGNDGAITVSVDGGVSPFSYAWEGQSSTTNVLTTVKIGTYKVIVTDGAGCKRDSMFTITQPLKALDAKIAVVPVCFGRTNGVITITPSGGTSPYQFSVDNGSHYQEDPVFNTVGVGDYDVKVLDSKGCISTGEAKIIQRNDQPMPDFIVASKEHARDTLSVREISIPKPDSVHWIFDSRAVITNNNEWAPEIAFSEAGEYTVTMIGYFQACDYSVTRTITMNPYDPNAVPANDPSYRPIESVMVTPNPNNGEFDVTVKLNKKYRLSIVVYDVLGGIRFSKSFEPTQNVTERITLTGVAAGVYMLRAITNTDAKDVRIMINK